MVFEIGSGFGFALKNMLEFERLRELKKRIGLIGIDIISNGKNAAGEPKFIRGDAVTKPFPKADLIFSLWSLGYMGNVGFMVKKSGECIEPGGSCSIAREQYRPFSNQTAHQGYEKTGKTIGKHADSGLSHPRTSRFHAGRLFFGKRFGCDY